MILPIRVSTWPEPWKHLYEERAAIIEHDAGLPKADAERQAEAIVRKEAS